MTIIRGAVLFLVLASLGANAFFLKSHFGGDRQFQLEYATVDQLEVIRTKGGLLQVSSIRAPESFSATKPHNLLGFDLGPTTTQIRVPAVFTYQIELAPEWKVRIRPDRTVVVIAPPAKPLLPVAIDTSRLEGFAGGRWSLLTGNAELAALQKTITQTLAVKAGSPSYIKFQREAARETTAEFIHKWLVTQERWKDIRGSAISVYFADEEISKLPSSVLASGAADR